MKHEHKTEHKNNIWYLYCDNKIVAGNRIWFNLLGTCPQCQTKLNPKKL